MGLFSNIVGCIMIIIAVLCILAGIIAWFAIGLIPLVLLGIGFLSGVPAPVDWLYQVVMELVLGIRSRTGCGNRTVKHEGYRVERLTGASPVHGLSKMDRGEKRMHRFEVKKGEYGGLRLMIHDTLSKETVASTLDTDEILDLRKALSKIDYMKISELGSVCSMFDDLAGYYKDVNGESIKELENVTRTHTEQIGNLSSELRKLRGILDSISNVIKAPRP